MIGHLRVKSPLSQLGIFLGLFGAFFMVASMLMAIVVVSMGIPLAGMENLDWSKPGILPVMKLVQAISSILIFLLPAIGFAMITFNGRPFYFLGLRPVANRRMLVLAVICILAAFPFVMWLGEINQNLPLPQWMIAMEKDTGKQMEAFLKANNTMDIVINVFIVAFLPAVCEEICFRGALQRIIIHLAKNPWLGIIITSLLFSALHFQFLGFLPRMFLGMILGALCWYSGSLWPGIVAHFVNNAVQVVAVSYAPEYVNKNPSISIYAALISGVAVWGILWVYRSYSTITYKQVYEHGDLNEGNQFLV